MRNALTNLSRPFGAWILLFCVPFFIQCTKKTDPTGIDSGLGIVANGTGYNGAQPRELVARCGVQPQSGVNTYQVTCGIFKTTANGEVPVNATNADMSVSWKELKTVAGIAPTSSSCQANSETFSQTCQITIASTDPVTLAFDAVVTLKAESVTLSDSVMLPYLVQTMGFNPKVGQIFSGQTASSIPHLEPLALAPMQVRLQQSQLCSVDQGVFIADNDVVYLWSQNLVSPNAATMRVFAGSIWAPLSMSASNAWKDRYRLPFQSSVAIDCRQGPGGPADYTLYVLSTLPYQGSKLQLALTTITATETNTQFISTNQTWGVTTLRSMRVGPDGKWYFIDSEATAIYSADPTTSDPAKRWVTYAGNGSGDTIEGVSRQNASFKRLQQLAFKASGDLFVSDMLQQKVFRIDTLGVVRTAVGTGTLGTTLIANNPMGTQLYFPTGLTLVKDDLYITEATTSRLLVLRTATASMSAITGITNPATDIESKTAQSITVRSDGSIWVSYAEDVGSFFFRVGRVTATLGTSSAMTRFDWMAGITKREADELTNGGDLNLQKQIFTNMSDAAIDPRDNTVVISESGNYRLLRVSLGAMGNAELTPLAGQPFARPLGTLPDSPDGTPAVNAAIHAPVGVAVGADGSIYFTESSPKWVKKIDSAGKLQSVADLTGIPTKTVPALSSHILFGIAILTEQTMVTDENGASQTVNLPTLAVADQDSQQVLKITPSLNGKYTATTLANVVTLASVLPSGFSPGLQPWIPYVLKTDLSGNLYIASNVGLYRLDRDGAIYRIAGGGYNPDPRYEGPATATAVAPRGMWVMADGSLYVTDSTFLRVIRLIPRPRALVPTYDLSLVASANTSIQTCGNGTLQGQGNATNIGTQMGSSLSQFCLGAAQAIVALDRCQGTQQDFTLLFSERLDIAAKNSVLVRATRSCH